MKRAGVLLGIGSEYVFDVDTDAWSVAWILSVTNQRSVSLAVVVSLSSIWKRRLIIANDQDFPSFSWGLQLERPFWERSIRSKKLLSSVESIISGYMLMWVPDSSALLLSLLLWWARVPGVAQHYYHRKRNIFFKASRSKTFLASPITRFFRLQL